MTTDDGSLNDLPEEFKYPSYASATANSQKSGQGTQFSSPTNSAQSVWQTPVDWQQEKQELEEKIKAQAAQIDRIQADLQAKITRSKDLEDKLADALDLAHSRDKRYEEMMNKFERLMDIHSSDQRKIPPPQDQHDLIESDTSNPATPERLNHQTDNPPPSKKANTNSSPHRNIYSLFRPPSGSRQTQKYSSDSRTHIHKKSNQLLLTQPMETDEDSRQPNPRAKSGHKVE